MIKFYQQNRLIVLKYTADDTSWVSGKISNKEEVSLKDGVFTFSGDDLFASISDKENDVEFIFARPDDGYFKIEGRILGIKQDVFFDEKIKISESFFIAVRNTSIFKKIGNVISEDIYIGGKRRDALPEAEFVKLIKDFPNAYEIEKYISARLAAVLSNYFESGSGVHAGYEKYMNKKSSLKGADLLENFREEEIFKYTTILKKLEGMLENQDSYIEKQWQDEIAQIILLLNPKYTYFFKEAKISDSQKNKDRKVDFLLVDSNGNVDIVEIKRPTGESVVTKTQYRENHVPLRDLSGAVMQVEKYIYHLNKSGNKGEDTLTERYKSKLPENFKIRITNPSALIIMGRDDDLSLDQRGDFEIIKRKYRNIVDIITYDDLLRRLRATIKALGQR
jgi:hypothetical protein